MGGTLTKHGHHRKSETNHLFPFLDVEVNIEEDDRCSFSGITCFNDGHIVVCDYLDKHVKYYDTKSLTLLDFKKVDCSPYAVCKSARKQNELFVTLPNLQRILQFSLDGGKFELTGEIQAEGMCYGVSSFEDGLAVCLKIDTDVWQVEVIDYSGSVMKVFRDDKNGVDMFRYADYITMETDGSRLYVADGFYNSVVCLDLKNSSMTQATELYRYTDKHLKIPKGLTLDGAGNLFIVGCASNNVHKISATSGRNLGVVLYHESDIKNPMDIFYDTAEKKVFLTEGSRRVMIFKDV